ncbi:MAG: hypothetical protein DMG05_24020 [Acidobacteria bacterium]|nr:MAG: hypothetical protein DMG05_24020 [Acidobacteriota bacterium]
MLFRNPQSQSATNWSMNSWDDCQHSFSCFSLLDLALLHVRKASLLRKRQVRNRQLRELLLDGRSGAARSVISSQTRKAWRIHGRLPARHDSGAARSALTAILGLL